MCGITGAIWNDPARAIETATLAQMTDVLAHRGPDDRGTFASDYRLRPGYAANPGVALGHRRLAIIDVAGGQQPMANEDQTIWVVFNGEIYNFPALRLRLEGAGHKLRTQSDTEVLIHLYEDEGPDFVEHLVGMFSLAIWDANKRRLLLARDRLGQKPLVYRQETNRLLFASELKSLLAVPNAPREIDPNALDEYLTYQYVPHPNTILRGYRKLPPAHYALWCDGELSLHRYWKAESFEIAERPQQEYVDSLRRDLTASVATRMQSEVPLGAFLSGGVDSSLIAALMQRESSEPIRTFSIGFGVPEFDESEHARRVAEHLGTRHEEFRVDPEATEILPKLVWQYDEPFADSSAIPTLALAELTRKHVTVALSGDGGDELFAGYERYRAVALADKFDRAAAPLRKMLAGSYWQKLPSSSGHKSRLRRLKRFTEALSLPPARRYLQWIAIFNETRRAELYADSFIEQLADSDPYQFLGTAWRSAAGRDAVAQVALADLMTYLPCDLMNKVDIATMAHGLECRQPFLDHRVVELALQMPTHLKYRGGRGKRILADAFGDLLPAWVFRRRKMGFGVPLNHWFRDELKSLAHHVLLDTKTRDRGYFREETIRRLLKEHTEGQADHSSRLWSLLVLELWMREWIDR